MLNKKGMEITLGMIVIAIPLLILLGILLYNLFKSQTLVSGEYNKLQMLSKMQSCKSQGAFSQDYFDNDFGRAIGDKYPDSCDVCLGGDDAKDSDADGMPDACDNDPNNPPATKGEKICKSNLWDAKRMQCTLQCYKDALSDPTKACKRI